ncbi:multidrug and toxin extrusion protein 1 [Cololabis saira]|uniref:multidrug and toxin extrusion protein 1 n=1 Tax=Cololabis saira TaxID=129043 RepID=UPI002AD44153|nr:multidrug and toxin extrusion protein 1 [Cololabis saira]
MERLGSLETAHPSPGAVPVARAPPAKATGPPGDEEPAGASSKLFWCSCVKRWLPPAYRDELYHVLRLTGPLLLSRILNFLLPFVITIFCGHIGNAELAGYALASATINFTTTSTGYGLGVACDTLISQTFGGKNLMRVGVILQRSVLILLLFCLPCWGLLINAHNILLLMHQEGEVARIAQLYVMVFIPAVPAMFLHLLQVSYLQNQGIILPQMYTAAAANVFNLGINFLLITVLELGVMGSAIANSLSQIMLCLLLFGYIRWRKLHLQTWGGWSTDSLQEWGSFMKLAVPSALMVFFEWWIWEIGGFLAGVLGETDLAAQHVLLEVGAITFMFPLGVHAATCVRVGNALGAGNTERAIVTCKVSLILAGVLAVVQGVVLASCKSVLGFIFTSDVTIVSIVSENLTLYIFLQFFDALLCVCSGILIGSGMQKIAALSNLVCYYCIGLPVGIALMFTAKLRILGFWLGLSVAISFMVVFYLILISRLNWKKVTQKAQLRAGKTMGLTPKRPGSTILNEGMLPDIAGCVDTANAETTQKPGGYRPVSAHRQEDEDNNAAAGRTETDGEPSKASSSPAEKLPVPQLILRRGLTLLGTVAILFICVGFHFAFPPPEPGSQSRANFTLSWANDSTPTPLAPLNPTSDF